MKKYQYLILERLGPLVKITLNRPECLNALNIELFNELTDALLESDMDKDCQIVVITGAGRGFCTGADLKSVVAHHSSERNRWSGAYDYAKAADGLFRQIREMGKIVIAMVNGAAYGGGLVLATCSDIAVASEDATFRIPEAVAGIADELSTIWLSASIGLARAKYLILTAEVVTAEEALRLGFIAKVSEPTDLWTNVMRVASQVLKTGPNARSSFKRILNERLPEPRMRHIVESHLSEECFEGCAAFAEKRSPAWDKGELDCS